MVSMRSEDEGKTWTGFNPIEPYSNASTGQVSAYGSIAARPDGSRIFALWIQNVNNISHLPNKPLCPSMAAADMLGNFVWKYSDDHGKTWSPRHYTIPVPFNYIETINSFSKAKNGTGDVQIMWEVDHLKTLKDGTLIFAFTKIGTYAVAAPEEMFVMASRNLLTEEDPDKVVWDMWPHGDHGITAPGHPDDPTVVSEEPHVVPSKDRLTILFRTSPGYVGLRRVSGWRFSGAVRQTVGKFDVCIVLTDLGRQIRKLELAQASAGPTFPKTPGEWSGADDILQHGPAGRRSLTSR